MPQEEPFEANAFPAKPRTLKAQEVPGEEQWVPEATSPPQYPVHSMGGLCFFAARGRQRISAAVLLPLLSCLPKAPSLESGLAFPLCLALCPQDPTQL